MVVFTCNNCGESLKKAVVDKHYQFQCRKPISVCCVDCLKDFCGYEYNQHTQCITENERYGGKDYVPKPSANKGQKKQQEWLGFIQNMLDTDSSMSNQERNFLQLLSKHPNMPRKKAKYLNFVKSAYGNRINANVVENIWIKLDAAYKAESNNKSNNSSANGNSVKLETSLSVENQENSIAENENNENISKEIFDSNKKELEVSKTNKKRKKKGQESVEEENEEEPVSKKRNKDSTSVVEDIKVDKENGEATNGVSKFSWKNTIIDVVSSKGEISLKKLEKKVVNRYLNVTESSRESAAAKFNKKLGKVKGVVVEDEKVRLAMDC